eukprot:360019-Chlamydomonas_euryale.AAC.18
MRRERRGLRAGHRSCAALQRPHTFGPEGAGECIPTGTSRRDDAVAQHGARGPEPGIGRDRVADTRALIAGLEGAAGQMVPAPTVQKARWTSVFSHWLTGKWQIPCHRATLAPPPQQRRSTASAAPPSVWRKLEAFAPTNPTDPVGGTPRRDEKGQTHLVAVDAERGCPEGCPDAEAARARTPQRLAGSGAPQRVAGRRPTAVRSCSMAVSQA